ncbi:MAG: hypothetical protein AAF218_04890 [Pseudomonadota bacterium]
MSTAALLTRKPSRPVPGVPLLPNGPELARARVHEACGLSRRSLAIWLSAQTQGAILWAAPAWDGEGLNPCGIMPFVDPARLIFVRPRRPEDILWTVEETLRSGTVALVVADLPGLPSLTQVRRMHLAAETGAALAPTAPVGLLLTPGQLGGAPGVESRWSLTPAHAGGSSAWTLERLRARTAPVKAWRVTRTPGHALPHIANTDRAQVS